MLVDFESVELTVVDETAKDFDSDGPPVGWFKSTWGSIVIQTNLEQNLRINATRWSLEFDYGP